MWASTTNRNLRLAALVFLVAATARADAPPRLDVLLAQLTAASAHVDSLRGVFVQDNQLKLFKQELHSTGMFYFHRPRQIRWEYQSPDPSTMVLNGNAATIRTPGSDAQSFDLAKEPSVRAVFDQILVWLEPSALAAAQTDYDLSTEGSAKEPVLVLRPKAGSLLGRTFSRVALRLDGKELLLRAIELTETNGDQKTIRFTKMERNQPLPPNAFK